MNFCVETCDVSSLVPRRISWLGEETIFCMGEEVYKKGEEGLQKKWETRRDETLTLDVRDAVRTYHCKTTPCTTCTPHPVTTRHDHLEAVVVRITGEQRVHHCQGILQVEDLIVITVVFAARQSQHRRGRFVEVDPQNLIQILFNPGIGARLSGSIFNDSSKSRSN